MMVNIREYCQETDARAVGILIADTFATFNLNTFSTEQQTLLLGLFDMLNRQNRPIKRQ